MGGTRTKGDEVNLNEACEAHRLKKTVMWNYRSPEGVLLNATPCEIIAADFAGIAIQYTCNGACILHVVNAEELSRIDSTESPPRVAARGCRIRRMKPEAISEDLESPSDHVNHPSHYKKGKVECIDAIESAVTGLEGSEAVLTGNIIKYVFRWKWKGGVEDLKKAKWYLDRLIDSLVVDKTSEV